jgi:beta-1,4-mannosyl-glycoprotein beta-1,4-N-acetylglucosaminyltransferase
MKKIYDCFVFNNELDLLEIRLNELNEFVDHFVLVEGEHTWQNNKKELVFVNNKHRFQKFLNKIHYIVIPEDKFVPHTWTNERTSFDYILTKLKSINLNNDDIVMISCCDEIPNIKNILNFKDAISSATVFEVKLYYYYVNTIFNHWGSIFLPGTIAIPYKNLLEKTSVYDTLLERNNIQVVFKNSGWHFSYIGGTEQIHTKLQSFSHSEYNNIPKDTIFANLNNLQDPFNRNNVYFDSLEPEKNWPHYLQQNKETFKHLIYNP